MELSAREYKVLDRFQDCNRRLTITQIMAWGLPGMSEAEVRGHLNILVKRGFIRSFVRNGRDVYQRLPSL